MGLFSRPQSTRSYPAAGQSVSGPANRFFRSKTTGARQADRLGQAWEGAERQRERYGRRRQRRG